MTDTIRAAGTLDLTVHRRDTAVRPDIRVPERSRGARQRVIVQVAREAEGHAGSTLCGKPLLLNELWVDYVPETIDRLCPTCFPDDPARRLAATA